MVATIIEAFTLLDGQLLSLILELSNIGILDWFLDHSATIVANSEYRTTWEWGLLMLIDSWAALREM